MTELFPTIVYILCFLASSICAAMLGRSYWRSGMRLLLWSSICFALLAANNLLLVLDLVVWPDDVDLRVPRLFISLFAAGFLIWGLSAEIERE